MNVCMCGYQPGAAQHADDCPYPLFRGSERDYDQWENARRRRRLVLLAHPEYAEQDEDGQLSIGVTGEQRAIPGLAAPRAIFDTGA